MENNFYHIEIGTVSKRGNMQVHHSFVVGTENSNQTDVYNHFNKKYSGLDVRCQTIKTVVFESIINPAKVDSLGRTENEKKLQHNINRLEEKINNQQTKGTSIIKDSLRWERFPEELYKRYESKLKECSKLHGELKTAITDLLKSQYEPFCKEIRILDSIGLSTTNLNYEVVLNGKLKTEFEDLK